MSDTPPAELADLLERLGLAAPAQVARVGPRVRRLARNLPAFQSVWVDALAQARLVTPFQAARINQRRGEELAVGPYVLLDRVGSLGYAEGYRAQDRETGRPVYLCVFAVADGAETEEDPLAGVAELSAALDSPGLAPIRRAGRQGDRRWVAADFVPGETAAARMVRAGRLPPAAAREIAAQLVEGLTQLEARGLCHGDIAPHNVMLTPRGDAVLTMPLLRARVRADEGFAHADLAPAYYEGLAPERITLGAPPSVRTDIFSLGCLLWHLLAGRSALPGGDALGKLRAQAAAQVADVHPLAPQTPRELARLIEACCQPEAENRPQTMAEVAQVLGPPTRRGRGELARTLVAPRFLGTLIPQPRARRPKRRRSAWPVVATVALLAALASMIWAIAPIGRPDGSRRPAVASSAQPAEATSHGVVSNDSKKLAPEAPVPAATHSAPAPPRKASPPPERLLPADRAVRLDTASLRPGQRIAGPADRRAVVAVEGSALVLTADDLRFENIDFVWTGSSAGSASGPPAALVELKASGAKFRRCSFQAAESSPANSAAIGWTYPAQRSELDLPHARLQLTDCTFRRLAAGIDCRVAAAVSIELTNVLYLGSGPLVRFDHCPRRDEPTGLTLTGVTLRACGPLAEWCGEEIPSRPGSVSIHCEGSVFAPAEGVAVLTVVGPAPPEPLFRQIYWTGQGSLVMPKTPLAVWRTPRGELREAHDDALAIAGLVRGAVSFAGPADEAPGSSRIDRWQVPLRSSRPPGIDSGTLDWYQP